METQTFKIPATAFEQTHCNIRFLRSQKTRFIAGDENPLLPSAYSAPDTVDPGADWQVTSSLILPRQLQSCTQTVRLPYLDIKHFLSVEIALQIADDLIMVCYSFRLLRQRQLLTSSRSGRLFRFVYSCQGVRSMALLELASRRCA
jgi:hypothetical protein